MCGKFTQLVEWQDVFALMDRTVVMPEDAPVAFSTPMRSAKVIRLDENGRPELVQMRWGFPNPDAEAFKSDHMHARGETIDSRQLFSESFEERRGILMVHTFNEGEDLPGGKRRQWVIRPKDGKPIAMAVIWQEWESGEGPVTCFVMATTEPNPLIARVTDRMPAILPAEAWAKWLGEEDASLADIKSLLRPYDDAGNWEMTEQAPTKSAAKGKKKPDQGDLF